MSSPTGELITETLEYDGGRHQRQVVMTERAGSHGGAFWKLEHPSIKFARVPRCNTLERPCHIQA